MSAESAPAPTPPLWPNGQQIEIVGLTGEYESGKTVFGLTIDPKRTLMYDEEKSGASYLSLGFDRIDVIAEVRKKHPFGFTPIQVYEWWLAHVRAIEPGRYRVIMLDTVGTIEAGLADWVSRNPKHFGHTANQYERAGGLFWGDVKEHWKLVLSDLASRCETFVFTSHMGNVWKGNQPTGQRKPKGKETLMELASLYLRMERTPDAKGNKRPQPSAVVLKSRLAHTRFDPETGLPDVIPILPPRLPMATPAAIRKYILTPPDYSKLSPEEQAPERHLSDDERLELEAAKAAAELETEQLRARARGATADGQEDRPTAVSSQTATFVGQPGKITKAQFDTVAKHRSDYLVGLCGPTASTENMAGLWKRLLSRWGVDSAVKMTEAQAAELIQVLTRQLSPPPVASEPSARPVQAEQLFEIKKLSLSWLKIHGPNPPSKETSTAAWRDMLKAGWGVTSAVDMTADQADALIAKLTAEIDSTGPTAGLFLPPTERAPQSNPQTTPTNTAA